MCAVVIIAAEGGLARYYPHKQPVLSHVKQKSPRNLALGPHRVSTRSAFDSGAALALHLQMQIRLI